jgi:hypothetical protein
VAVVFLDQRQGQIDPRGDPGRGPQPSIAHMDAFVDDLAWYDNEWAYASKLIDMAAVVNAGSARG